MRNPLMDLFSASELFVEQFAFRAWLAEAQVKAGGLQSADGVQAAMLAYDQREVAPRLVGDVAVIDVAGPITYKTGWLSYYFGGCGIADLQQKFRMALADPAVRTVLFRFDSPGGEVTMVPEFADEVFAARSIKPIIGVADTLVASAAYWIASQVETLYAPVSGRLGSIGVYTEHLDISGMLEKSGVSVTLISHGPHKVDGHPYAPLPEDVRARIQARVDEIGVEFETAVARGRAVSRKDVVDTFGGGEVFRGKQAISLGMADKLGTCLQVVARLTKNRPLGSGLLAGADAAEAGDRVAAPSAAPAPVADGGCKVCAESGCGCEADEEECPEDCPTCDPECGCRQAGEASARAAAQSAADADAAAIAVVLADES